MKHLKTWQKVLLSALIGAGLLAVLLALSVAQALRGLPF